MSRRVAYVVVIAMVGLATFCVQQVARAELAADPVADLVFVADDNAIEADGCDGISVLSLDSPQPVYRGRTFISPSRLAATSDLSLVVATNSSYLPQRFLYLLSRDDEAPAGWTTEGQVFGANVVSMGGIAIAPDNESLLVATQLNPGDLDSSAPQQFSRFAVSKYLLSELRRDVLQPDHWYVGPRRGYFPMSHIAAEIVADGAGRAHVVTVNQRVVTLDIASMTSVAAAIQMATLGPEAEQDAERYAGAVHATLSPDGRYLVTNRWHAAGGKLNVADLQTREAWTVDVAPDVDRVGGVALNHAAANHGRLAIHARDHVGVYAFAGRGPLIELARAPVTASPFGLVGINGPVHSIAWSAGGSAVIAEDVTAAHGVTAISVDDDGRRLTPLHHWKLCSAPGKYDWPNDIITANGSLPPATPHPTSTGTVTPRPTATPSPTATIAPSVTPTETRTTTPTPTLTRTPRPPADIFLPMALRERCPPFTVYVDVALVVDASTSMLEPTSQGRTKLEATREALRTFVGGLRLEPGGDRAAIITFNERSNRLQPLTWDVAALDNAIERIEAHPGSRVDMGILRALFELAETPTQRDRYLAMVVLTDGRTHAVPDAEVIAAAEEARALGVVLFVVGVGTDMNEPVLRAMAGEPARFSPAPDAEALTAIYRTLTEHVICPPEVYWPRR